VVTVQAGDDSESISYGGRITQLALTKGAEPAVSEVSVTGLRRSLSWQELDDMAGRLARTLQEAGLGRGDSLAVCLANCLEHFVADVAAWKLGAIPVAIRWDLPEWELTRLLDVLAPRVAFRNGPGEVLARLASTALPASDVVSPHRFGVCSSGSTGMPKVILHTSPGLYANGPRSTSAVVEAYRTLSTPQTLLVPNALYHSASITTAVLNLISGNHTIVLERFVPEVLLETVARDRVTGFMAPTPMLLRLARSPALRRECFDSLEWVQHGASPLPEWLARFWIDFLGPARFFTSYGAAEAVGVVACRGEEWLAHPGTLGRGALGTDVVVLGDDGQRLAPGEVGRIFLRRPGGPSGTYAGRGVAPLEIDLDGFATVGDLGWLDEDGFVYLSDRRVDLIVSGGANVYPAEVEGAVGEHPDVADVVVIGLPDEEWGKRVHAIVQRSPAATLTAEDVREFTRARLARYKVPKTVEFVEQIPRSAATKVNRAALIAERVRDEGA
jgi:bile acid-coenzyme A ligase